jgi:hypothetical protein
LYERGVDIYYETIRFWWNQFGPKFAKDIRKKKAGYQSNWCWHIDDGAARQGTSDHRWGACCERPLPALSEEVCFWTMSGLSPISLNESIK